MFTLHTLDENTGALADKECANEINADSIVFETQSYSRFVSFFEEGWSIMKSSNFDVWGSFSSLTYSSLKSNLGFWFSCAYIGILVSFGIIAIYADHKNLKGKFYLNIQETIRSNSHFAEIN